MHGIRHRLQLAAEVFDDTLQAEADAKDGYLERQRVCERAAKIEVGWQPRTR